MHRRRVGTGELSNKNYLLKNEIILLLLFFGTRISILYLQKLF